MITVTVIIACDGCSVKRLKFTHENLAPVYPTSALNAAQQRGWEVVSLDGGKLHLCPACSKQHHQAPEFYSAELTRSAINGLRRKGGAK
jgi:hypothetical protein